ncbi:MAG: hypothetical protein WC613_06300 [Candidatus Aenigmatarchaeota archaeon]
MTPEQLETIFRKVISEGVTLDTWLVITIALLCLIGLGLGAYIRKKGDNLATKEDIGDITRKVEEVKAEFIKVSYEHQIRFSKLHDNRAEVIAELYSRLYDYYWAVCAFLRDFHKTKPDEKEFKKLDDKSYEFSDYFHKHRIYFDEDLCSKIDELIPTLYSAYVPLESRDSNDKHLNQDWDKCAEIVRKQYPKIKESLESDFRKILGVTE